MSEPRRKRRLPRRLPPPTKREKIAEVKSLTIEEIDEHLDKLFNLSAFKGNAKAISDSIEKARRANRFFAVPSGRPVTGTRCTKFEDPDYPNVCISSKITGIGLIKSEDAMKMFNRFKERFEDRLRAERIVQKTVIAKKKVIPSIPKDVGFRRVGAETFISIPPSERLPLITSRDEPELILGTGKVRSSVLLGVVAGSARIIPIAEIILDIRSKEVAQSGVLGEVVEEIAVEEIEKEKEPRQVPSRAKGRAQPRGRQRKRVKITGTTQR